MKEKLSNHLKLLNKNQVPTSVANKPVGKWKERVEVFEDFIKNFETYKKEIKVQHYATPVSQSPISLMDTPPAIQFEALGAIDGGDLAKEKGAIAKKKPIMLIAANAEHIGGSLYRVVGKKTGDAQEEQAGNNYAGALAVASIPGAATGIDAHGDIHYSKGYHDLLLQRGAIDVSNIPGPNGIRCDQILLAAPDLKNQKECFIKGTFQAQNYAEQILTMYRNAFSALANKDPGQPIIFTLPGSGVYLGDDPIIQEQAKKIQGLCLRQVLNENPSLANHKFYLPYGKNSPVLKFAMGDVANNPALDQEKKIVSAAIANLGKDQTLKQVAVNDLGIQAQNLTTSFDKKLNQTNLLLSFPNTQKAEEMTQRLFNMGIRSTTKPSEKKSVLDNNKVVLTAKDAETIRQKYQEIQQESNFLRQIGVHAKDIVPSVDNKSGQTNLLVVFDNAQEVKKFIDYLSKQGIDSATKPGQPKSILPGNAVILTKDDCKKLNLLNVQPTTPKKTDHVAAFKQAIQEKYTRNDNNTDGYTDAQNSVYNFALCCCDFPKLVVSLVDKNYDIHKAAEIINKLDVGNKYMDLNEVTAALDAQIAMKPK